MITIIDYGMGNLRSILNILRRMEIDAVISSKVDDIEAADRLILPGVGFFAKGMLNLKEYDLLPILNKKVLEDRTPILGICLGMQLLTKRSEEGNAEGLGWIDEETKKFRFGGDKTELKIPHMGWNSINILKESPLLEGISNGDKFYFVHSYHVCSDTAGNHAVATTNYDYDFTSVVQKDNIYGTQFHPEKSHKAGMQVLSNFVERA